MDLKIKSIIPFTMTQKETLEWSFLYRKHVQNFYAENYKTLMKELREDRWRDVMSL